ncbi:VCBS repeat-containing protein [Chitinophaga sp. MM2321]|uniref:FG-GAP repeat domain-containing protein n=1 Tax=Chitinophaga sp. MM2321 TaxID=3137178 RepID=UPI0032D5AE2B
MMTNIFSKTLAVCCMIISIAVCHSAPVLAQDTNTAFQILKYNNPGLIVDLGVGLWAWPIPIDFDNDGDMDMLVSCPDKPFNGLYYFENTSGDKNPVFAVPVKLSPSIKDIQISYVNGQARILVPGAEILHFTQTFGEEKKELLAVDAVLHEFSKKPRFNQWKLVDYDNDGDEDIIMGIDDWSEYGWDDGFSSEGKWNSGPLHGYVFLIENKDGKYLPKKKIQAAGVDIDVYGAPSPNFADFDGDGDLDLICGEFLDKLTWFENIGTRSKPVYAKGRLLENPSGIIKMDLEMIVPVAVDWDKDGFTDLVVGDEDGRVALIRHTGKVKKGMPVFESPVYFKQQADNVKCGALATPVSVDWDGDGDEDIISGSSAGYISFFENLGVNGATPKWAAPKLLESAGKVIRIQAGENGSIQGPSEAKWGYTTLSVADWDGDGLKDIIVNSIWGQVIWYKNTGSKRAPKLAKQAYVKVDWDHAIVLKPSWIWWKTKPGMLVPEWRTTPYVIDWNKDGITDLIMLDHEGYLSYFEGFKKAGEKILKPGKRIFYGTEGGGFNANHKLTVETPGPLILNTRQFGAGGRRKFTIADWDGDGKPDILVNSLNVSMLKNTGTVNGMVQINSNPAPMSTKVLAGHDTSPTTVDWNKDGIPDLLVGAEDGHFYYMPNPNIKK